ncbi:MAG TPA: hypothetical protein VKY65_08720 [Alphaproteobacteria bacterium]|nr:hypothetical protein [Alphaproteobacteria bacterium]
MRSAPCGASWPESRPWKRLNHRTERFGFGAQKIEKALARERNGITGAVSEVEARLEALKALRDR